MWLFWVYEFKVMTLFWKFSYFMAVEEWATDVESQRLILFRLQRGFVRLLGLETRTAKILIKMFKKRYTSRGDNGIRTRYRDLDTKSGQRNLIGWPVQQNIQNKPDGLSTILKDRRVGKRKIHGYHPHAQRKMYPDQYGTMIPYLKPYSLAMRK